MSSNLLKKGSELYRKPKGSSPLKIKDGSGAVIAPVSKDDRAMGVAPLRSGNSKITTDRTSAGFTSD